ncbi:hypothetical protein PHYPSEUDO_004068 [Phytophthora pseudosyringae]|uniref:Uncharacterized protein n=1 Tax=Phytophthora pseudosyringae TaxID=221518 RepID=A0A8T1V6A7_9STRA|nr:hypothetical protein PHYPSEUDO_004068 [Phytophthora pseudosyringae]
MASKSLNYVSSIIVGRTVPTTCFCLHVEEVTFASARQQLLEANMLQAGVAMLNREEHDKRELHVLEKGGNIFGTFHETNTCHVGDKLSFASNPGESSGTHKFQAPEPIRSMMIGEHMEYSHRPHVIAATCHPDRGNS